MASIDTPRAAPARGFFLNDPVFRGIVYQIVVAVLVVGFLVWIVNNTAINLAAQNKTTGFDFLWKTAGFDISFSLFPWSRTSYYWQAFLVGLTNTILVAVISIVLATALGFTVGIARLSSNFIISRLAAVFVEILRNIPPLLVLFFFYFAVLKTMPAVRNSIALPFDLFINQRGIFVPKPMFDADFIWVGVAAVISLAAAILIRRWANQVRQAMGQFPRFVTIAGAITNAIVAFLVTGVLLAMIAGLFLDFFDQAGTAMTPGLVTIGAIALIVALVTLTTFSPYARVATVFLATIVVAALVIDAVFPFLTGRAAQLVAVAIGLVGAWFALRSAGNRRGDAQMRFPVSLTVGLIILLPVIVYYVSGTSVAFEPPVLDRFNFKGGLALPPEFVALAIGLAIYTAAFIAETVRAGILAVSHGQTEAAQALGLRDRDRLRLVVIPQAMRVIIPPLTSEYLSLTKNSSLGAAIGYPELVNVWAGTALNQTGRAIECIGTAMAVYLVLSLATSAIMNWYNARVALVER